jgi:DNA-binding FadR family transcriptional regulator
MTKSVEREPVAEVKPASAPSDGSSDADLAEPVAAASKEPGAGESGAEVAIRRVRKAYEQVADQLRELILQGELSPGMRLPNEVLLARDFGVSRATIREALRVLAAQNLIRTSKGVHGGSYITLPSVDHVSEFVRSSLSLMSESRSVSLEEFLEAREVLEVPAARLAALHRRESDLVRLRDAIPAESLSLGREERLLCNKDFHSTVLEICGNTLLYIAAQPVFSVLQTNLARSAVEDSFHETVDAHHRRITAAIEAGDAAAAAQEMRDHLAFLRPVHEKAWQYAAVGRSGRPPE